MKQRHKQSASTCFSQSQETERHNAQERANLFVPECYEKAYPPLGGYFLRCFLTAFNR